MKQSPIVLGAILIWSSIGALTGCSPSQKNVSTGDSSDVDGSFQLLLKPSDVPFVHWELLSNKAEERIGNEPYILVLPVTYQTDSTAEICIANIQHSADIANGSPDTNRLEFPYIKYAVGINRFSTWVYVSKRLVPNETANVKAWMLQESAAYHAQGMKVDSSGTNATIMKIAWRAHALQ